MRDVTPRAIIIMLFVKCYLLINRHSQNIGNIYLIAYTCVLFVVYVKA